MWWVCVFGWGADFLDTAHALPQPCLLHHKVMAGLQEQALQKQVQV